MEASTAPQMTRRQKQVFDRLEKGQTPTEIAKALKITVNAIYQYRRRFVQKGLLPESALGSGTSNARSGNRSASTRKATASANGNGSPAILKETTKVLHGERERIGAALKENHTERERVEAEIAALTEKKGHLKDEGDALTRTERALVTAEQEVMA